MKVFWSETQMVASTIGDVVWGIVMSGVALWLGVYAGNHYLNGGEILHPLPVLAILVVVFFGPIGACLIYSYRRLKIDFEAQTYRFRDGVFDNRQSRCGSLDEIVVIEVETLTKIRKKGAKITLLEISYQPRDSRQLIYAELSIPGLTSGGLEIASSRNEGRITALIEKFTSRYPFEVRTRNKIEYV